MKLAWLTDIHFNFVSAADRQKLVESIDSVCDAVVITGDIGESQDVAIFLRDMELSLQRPIYFVLGNHDFYHGSIVQTREELTELAAGSKHLVYLTAEGVIELTASTALIGHDGWADARFGDFDNSNVILNDYVLIDELRFLNHNRQLDKPKLRDVLNHLGDETAEHLQRNLIAATQRYQNIFAATHVPPFREATWHEGKASDENWLPHFSCKAAGDAMLSVMRSMPECRLQVLCGHTHSGGEIHPSGNINVITGPATYGAPAIQRIFDIV